VSACVSDSRVTVQPEADVFPLLYRHIGLAAEVQNMIAPEEEYVTVSE
jgi:hypothetical protein